MKINGDNCMKTRAVIFDMDGVLVDSEPFIAGAAVRMFEEKFGIRVSAGDFKPFVGTGEDRYLGGVAEQYGLKLDMPADKERTYEIYGRIIRGKLKELPGVTDFIAFCRDNGIKTAVATSADEIKMRANLREIGVSPSSFDATVNGLEIERKKPFPDIYLEAARRIDVPPGRCLVVEDAVSGVKAAKSAGALCLGLATCFSSEELRAAGADFTAPNLEEADRTLLC